MTRALFAVGVGAGMGAALLGFAIRNALRAGGALRVKPAAALRCSLCGINWPRDVDHYSRCPVCLRPTDAVAVTGVEPLDPREARSISSTTSLTASMRLATGKPKRDRRLRTGRGLVYREARAALDFA